MADLPVARCRGNACRAPILWLPTPTGNRIPLEPQPTTDGNVAIEHDLLGEPYAQVLSPDAARRATNAGQPLHMPHHAVCPNAEEYRHA